MSVAKRAVIRTSTGIVVTVVIAGVAVVSAVLLVQAGDVETARRYGPPFLTAAYLTWLLFWWPMVELGDALVVRNPLRTFTIDWTGIEGVDNTYSLVVKTASRSITAWAAPAPRRRPTPGLLRRGIEPDRDVHDTGLAGVIRREVEKRRAVARTASGSVVARWNVLPAVAAMVLVGVSVVSALA